MAWGTSWINAELDAVLNGARGPVTLHVHTGDPGSSGANEVPGYAAPVVTGIWSLVADGQATNTEPIIITGLPAVTVTHLSLRAGGEQFLGGPCSQPVHIATGSRLEIPPGQMVVRIGSRMEPGDNDPETAVLILPETHRLWWAPGIPGGIPEDDDPVRPAQVYLPPGDPYDGYSIDPALGDGIANAQPAIQAAINAAGALATASMRYVVLLPPGIFNITGYLVCNFKGVVVRGAGTYAEEQAGLKPASTIIRNIAQTPSFKFGTLWQGYGGVPTISVVGSPRRGDRQIVVADASGITPGQIFCLDIVDDNGGDPYGNAGGYVWATHTVWFQRGPLPEYDRDSEGPVSPSGRRSIRQMIEVASIEGNTLHLANRLNFDVDAAMLPEIWDTFAVDTQFCGLEDMTFIGHYGTGVWFGNNSSYCWARNVECKGDYPGSPTNDIHVLVDGFRHNLHGCYIHHHGAYTQGGGSYGVAVQGGDCLIDNNIIYMANRLYLGQTSAGGNVIAYNYVDEAVNGSPEGVWQESGLDTSHASFSHSDLFEGNLTPNLSTDSVHGNNGWMTFFRNHTTGQNTSGYTTQNLRAIHIEGWNHEHASIGNVHLTPTTPVVALFDTPDSRNSGFVVYRLGNGDGGMHGGTHGFGTYDDGQAARKFHRHLDFDYFTNEQYDNPDNPVKVLPTSLYLTGKPAWWPADAAWPWVDPAGATHGERVRSLPAKVRFDLLTGAGG